MHRAKAIRTGREEPSLFVCLFVCFFRKRYKDRDRQRDGREESFFFLAVRRDEDGQVKGKISLLGEQAFSS